MTDITCLKSINVFSIGVLLTNKIRSFHHTAGFESGLSDCHKMIITFLRACFKKLPDKISNIEIFKTFTKMISSMNLILNLAKELFINVKITSLTS